MNSACSVILSHHYVIKFEQTIGRDPVTSYCFFALNDDSIKKVKLLTLSIIIE